MEVADDWIARGVASVSFILRVIGINEATYYQRRRRQSAEQYSARKYSTGRPKPGYSTTKSGFKISDEQIKEFLLELVAGEESTYGYRKLAICLRRQHGLVINHKKVYRLCDELDILAPQRQVKVKHPRRLASNHQITGSDQLWEIDIKYGHITGEDRFFYLMSVIDVYDRMIIDYYLGLNCEGNHAAQLLQRSLWKRQLFDRKQRPIIRTDNGPQFISNKFGEACEQCNVEHERIPPKTPNKNAHIEAYHGQLERDCLARTEITTYQEAHRVISEYVDFYNSRRIHGSLYDLSPCAFRDALARQEVTAFVVNV